MPLQLRVLATGQLLEVPNEGQTIGREGGPADVQLDDPGLSTKHARIFADGSEWLIQDLGSSNGTLIGGIKINATTPIQLDDIITIGGTKLEVAKMWDAEVQRTMMVAAPIFDTVPTGTPAVQRKVKSAPPSAPRPAPAMTTEMRAPAATTEMPAPEEEASMAPTMLGGVGAMSPEAAQALVEESKAKNRPSAKRPAAVMKVEEEPAENENTPPPETVEGEPPVEARAAVDDTPAPSGFDLKYFLVAVPKAVAFYLAAIPLLMVNPIGYVKKGIADQKHPAMGKWQLMAYALPALFVSAFLPAIATGIALAVRGTFSVMSFIPIGPAIGAVIGAAVSGFLFHPVMKWIIEKLKGQSDETSRTNYFLMLMTATAVLAVPTAVSTLLTLVPLPFIGFLGVLIQIVASAASVFILYSWLVYFDVIKIVRTIVLVLGALGALGSLYGGVMQQVNLLRGGSSGSGDAAAAIAAAQKQAEELREKGEEAAAEAKEKGEEAAAEAKEKGEEAAAEAKEKGEEAAAEAKEKGEEAAAEAKEKKGEVKVAAVEKAEKAEKAGTAEKAEKAGETTLKYPEFAAMRDAVEKAVSDKPELLTGDAALQALYRQYSAAAFEVDSKYKALDAKNPADAKLNVHLKGAELHAKTEAAIIALHAKLKGGKAAPAPKEEKPAPAPKEEKKAAPAKEEKKTEAKPAPAPKEEKKAEAKPAPKEEKKAEAKPAPAKEEKKAEAKPAPAAKEEKKPAGKGKFAATSKPQGAEIWIDGKNTGKKTPLAPSSALELAAGKHSVVFKLNGKSSAAQEINVEANGQVTLKGVEIPGA